MMKSIWWSMTEKSFLDGKNIFDLSEKEMQSVRGKDIAMVFQDALSSLNPVFTVGNQILRS